MPDSVQQSTSMPAQAASAAPKVPDVPKIDPKAPLKIEEVEEEASGAPIEKFNQKLFILGGSFLAFMVLTVLAFSFLYLKIKPLEEKSVEISQEEPVETSEPEAEEVALNKDEISFEVLNGSGIVGEAKKAGAKLESLGYKVDKLGDAQGEHKGHELYLVKESLSLKDLLIADLGTDFEGVDYKGELTEGSASARLIIGE